MNTTEPPTPGEDWRARILGEVFDIARHCCPYGAGAVRPGAEGYTCPHHGWQQVAKTRPEGATTEPSLTLGETVWVEAVAARNASGDVLDLQEPSGGVYARVHPAKVRWRRMPDETAAEPSVPSAIPRRVETLLQDVIKAQGHVANVGNTATNNDARMAYGMLTRIADGLRDTLAVLHGQQIHDDQCEAEFIHEAASYTHCRCAERAAPEPLAAGVPVGALTDPRQRVLDEIGAERLRQDEKWGEQNHPDGTGPELVWSFTGPAAYVAQNARQDCQDAAAEHACTWKHILPEEIAEAFAESDSAKLRAELVQVAAVAAQWIEAIDRRQGETVAAVEPLAAGVPVGALTDEPGPGAYLIGDLLAVRFPQDTDDSRWAVQGGIDHDWLTWLAVRERYGDRPMRRLLPHTQPTTATLETTGEPLTLDAIRKRYAQWAGLDQFAEPGKEYALLGVLAASVPELLDELERMRTMAAENARLRQQRDKAWRERDHLRRWLREAAASLPDDTEPAQTPGGGDRG